MFGARGSVCLGMLPTLLLHSLSAAALQDSKEHEAMNYLVTFGYMDKAAEKSDTPVVQREDFIEALRSAQAMFGLPLTGTLDRNTLAMMRQPRCGVKDSVQHKFLKFSILGRWRRKHLTYRILNYTPDMTRSGVEKAIQAAFKYWTDVTPLTFQAIKSGHADIMIRFARGSHGDNVQFDGPGRTLAHAFIPEDGRVHFDEDETWTEGTGRGINLRLVAAHEIGHALGLGHSKVYRALMAPFYAGYKPVFKLHSDDVRGVQALYGERESDSDSTILAPPQITTSMPPTSGQPDPCTADLDAFILSPSQKGYAFKGDYVWIVSEHNGAGHPIKINRLWKELPGNLDAAVHSQYTGRTYFFKGEKMWQYRKFVLQKGFPRSVRHYGLPPNPQAAFQWPGKRKIFIFQGDGCWLWDEKSRNNLGSSPKNIGNLLTRTPSNLDAAIAWRNGAIYLFRADQYWRVNNRLMAEAGYPNSKPKVWMQCV
uniref:matrix metalloproteinase-19 isoform X1 n=2 Tax=Pristiophorus japonicus TaxID=55135 RepID=UPI00398E99A3